MAKLSSLRFLPQRYYLISKDAFKTHSPLDRSSMSHSFQEVFKSSDVEHLGGIQRAVPIELIFNYKDTHVIFMTYDHIHIFKQDMFNYATPMSKIYLTKSRDFTPEEYTRMRNCLWTNCVEPAAKPPFPLQPVDDEPYDDRLRRKKRMASDSRSTGELTSADQRSAGHSDDSPYTNLLSAIAMAAVFPTALFVLIMLYARLESKEVARETHQASAAGKVTDTTCLRRTNAISSENQNDEQLETRS